MFKKLFGNTEDLFFRKDEEGKDLFYPWGYPGEAFYVDDKQKRKISLFIGLYAALIIGYSVLAAISDAAFSWGLEVTAVWYLILFTMIVPCYVFAMYIIKNGNKFYVVPKENRLGKKSFHGPF